MAAAENQLRATPAATFFKLFGPTGLDQKPEQMIINFLLLNPEMVVGLFLHGGDSMARWTFGFDPAKPFSHDVFAVRRRVLREAFLLQEGGCARDLTKPSVVRSQPTGRYVATQGDDEEVDVFDVLRVRPEAGDTVDGFVYAHQSMVFWLDCVRQNLEREADEAGPGRTRMRGE